MTTATSVVFSLVLLLSIVVSSFGQHGHGDGHGAGGVEEELEHYMVVETSSLSLNPKALCSGLKVMPSINGTGTWVPVHRPYGPCSRALSTPSLIEMLRWDQLRTAAVRRKATAAGGGEDVLDPAKLRVEMQQVDHTPYGSFGFGPSSVPGRLYPTAAGDPVESQTMAIDTSIDVPWIQCRPCPAPQCYPQQDALFDPSTSSTAAPVRCGSRACAALGAYGNGCSVSGDCQYLIDYGDGRATAGTYMTDTLTVSPSTAVINFRFGCSHAVRGSFSGQTSGAMSLGAGRQSLLSQTQRMYGNAFSYCIPDPSSSGFLSLGGPAGSGASARFARTPLVRNANNAYLVRLRGINVAGRRLNVPPAVFAAGTIMDSSAIITQLPPTAYAALRQAFRNAMRAYTPTAGRGNLDTCYDFLGTANVAVPRVSLVFDRRRRGARPAVVELDPSAVMLDGCLAFTPAPSDSSVGFIGNVQQQTHEVLYDVGGGAVGFRRGAC